MKPVSDIPIDRMIRCCIRSRAQLPRRLPRSRESLEGLMMRCVRYVEEGSSLVLLGVVASSRSPEPGRAVCAALATRYDLSRVVAFVQ